MTALNLSIEALRRLNLYFYALYNLLKLLKQTNFEYIVFLFGNNLESTLKYYRFSLRYILCVVLDFASVFKRGLMYKGIYWPSLTNSFQSKHLELAYLRYSHRQRQKALIIVNIVDLLLKVRYQKAEIIKLYLTFQAALIVVWAVTTVYSFLDPTNIIWSVCCMSINIAICILGWWRCFANNYLHWAAVCTWLLLTTQSSLYF